MQIEWGEKKNQWQNMVEFTYTNERQKTELGKRTEMT